MEIQEMIPEKKQCYLRQLKRQYKKLWLYTMHVEVMIVMFNGILLHYVPKYYAHFLKQFWIAIAFALLNIIVTIKMKRSFQLFHIIISVLHFMWIFYGFATVPVFLTAITTSLKDCNPEFHACTIGVFNSDSFYTKMTIGLIAEMFFVVFLYGEMKRVCLFCTFPFEFLDGTQQVSNTAEKVELDGAATDQLPDKNPNEIIIVA